MWPHDDPVFEAVGGDEAGWLAGQQRAITTSMRALHERFEERYPDLWEVLDAYRQRHANREGWPSWCYLPPTVAQVALWEWYGVRDPMSVVDHGIAIAGLATWRNAGFHAVLPHGSIVDEVRQRGDHAADEVPDLRQMLAVEAIYLRFPGPEESDDHGVLVWCGTHGLGADDSAQLLAVVDNGSDLMSLGVQHVYLTGHTLGEAVSATAEGMTLSPDRLHGTVTWCGQLLDIIFRMRTHRLIDAAASIEARPQPGFPGNSITDTVTMWCMMPSRQ